MSRPWPDFAAYAFVYGRGLICLAMGVMKGVHLIPNLRPQADVPETDRQLDYFLTEAERLRAERQRVEWQRDALILQQAPNWPPKRLAAPQPPVLDR